MPGSMRVGGKLGRRRGQLNALSGLIFLQDSVSKQQFLVDTGAAVSVFPHRSSAASSGPLLSGADGKPISAWGKVTKKLNFGLHTFILSFILAAVSKPILELTSSLLTGCWWILSPAPCCSHLLWSQWAAQLPPPLQGLPRQFLTSFRPSAPSCLRFPALSATTRVPHGRATESAILLKPPADQCLQRPAVWIQTS
jgi:hypothetical protein